MRVFCDNYDCKYISNRESKKVYNHHFIFQCTKPGDLAIMAPVQFGEFNKKVFEKLGKETVICTGFKPKDDNTENIETGDDICEAMLLIKESKLGSEGCNNG